MTDTKQGARGYTVTRPDGTHYRTDEGGARMAAKREGYRVLMEAALSERGEAKHSCRNCLGIAPETCIFASGEAGSA